MAGVKGGVKTDRIFGKNEKNEKIEILRDFIKFNRKFAIKSIASQKKCIAVTRRAGCLILGSKSNTVSGKIESGRLATNRCTFNENSNF